jgi:hypothetical protein
LHFLTFPLSSFLSSASGFMQSKREATRKGVYHVVKKVDGIRFGRHLHYIFGCGCGNVNVIHAHRCVNCVCSADVFIIGLASASDSFVLPIYSSKGRTTMRSPVTLLGKNAIGL